MEQSPFAHLIPIKQKIRSSKNKGQIHLHFLLLKDNDFKHLIDDFEQPLEKIHMIRSQMTCLSIKALKQKDTNHLNSLMLFDNNLGDKGCKYISNLNAPKLLQLGVGKNNVTIYGCMHLSKGNWNDLKKLQIQQSHLQFESIKFIINGHWLKLESLLLGQNNIGIFGVKALQIGEKSQLKELFLRRKPQPGQIESLKNRFKYIRPHYRS